MVEVDAFISPDNLKKLRPQVPATEPRNLKFPQKWRGEGAKGVLAYVDQKPARLMQKRVHW